LGIWLCFWFPIDQFNQLHCSTHESLEVIKQYDRRSGLGRNRKAEGEVGSIPPGASRKVRSGAGTNILRLFDIRS